MQARADIKIVNCNKQIYKTELLESALTKVNGELVSLCEQIALHIDRMWQKSRVWLLSVKDASQKNGRKSARVFGRKSIHHLIFAQCLATLGQEEPTKETLSRWLCKPVGWLPRDLWGLLWDAGGREFGDYIKFILRWFKGIVEMCNETFREKNEGSEREGSLWIREEQA